MHLNCLLIQVFILLAAHQQDARVSKDAALERGDKNAAKAEMLSMDKEDRNLQGPYQIINNTDKDRS